MSPSAILHRAFPYAGRIVSHRGFGQAKFSVWDSQVLRHASNKSGTTAAKPISRAPVAFLSLVTVGTLAYYFFWPSESRHAPTLHNASLSGAHFTPVTVTASDPCADENTRFVTLTVPKESLPTPTTLESSSSYRPIWSVFIKDDDIQVERPYTPLEGLDKDGNMVFWIKKYEKGEVARWLHTKRPGEKVEIRGPVKTWSWQDGVWDEVVMVSVPSLPMTVFHFRWGWPYNGARLTEDIRRNRHNAVLSATAQYRALAAEYITENAVYTSSFFANSLRAATACDTEAAPRVCRRASRTTPGLAIRGYARWVKDRIGSSAEFT